MGRHPLPAQIQELRGTARSDRPRVELASGELVTDALACRNIAGYDLLTDRAKRVYLTACRWAINMKMLQLQDLHSLLMYAMEFDTYLDACREVLEQGMYVVKRNEIGQVIGTVVNPAVQVRNAALNNVRSLGAKFGFTPVDRLRIGKAGSGEPTRNEKIKSIRQEIIFDNGDEIDEQG